MTEHPTVAAGILNAALVEQRAGELLDCLFAGGGATVDASGRLVLATADQLEDLTGVGDDDLLVLLADVDRLLSIATVGAGADPVEFDRRVRSVLERIAEAREVLS